MSIKATTTIELIRVDDGDNGIIVSSTAPSNPITGQLWQSDTGQPIKRWDGTDWVIHYISIENLDVKTLSAIAANLGTVTAGTIKNDDGTVIFDVDNGTVEFRGKTDTEIKERLHLHSGVIQLYGHNKDGTGESTGVIDKTGMYCSESMLLQAPKIGMSTDSGTIGDIIAYITNLRSKHVGGSVIKNMATANTMLSLLSYTEVNTLLGTIYTKAEMSDYVYVQAMNGDVYANSAKVIATCYNPNSGYFNIYFDKSTSGSIRITYKVDVIKDK